MADGARSGALNRAARHLDALGVRVDAAALAAWLGAPARKGSAHVEDLALAFACAAGDRRAIAAFEETWIPKVVAALRKVGIDRTQTDDVLGWLRFELFAREGTPLIQTYSGRSDLGGWLRAIVIHEALRRVKRQRREVTPEAAADIPVPDLELSAMRGAHGPAFTKAIGEAFGALPVQMRNLLRQSFLDGLSIDALGRMYQVHRATAARRVQAAREALSEGVRSRLKAELRLRDSSIDRLITVDNLQVSLSRILRQTRP